MSPLRLLYVTSRTPFGVDAPFVIEEIRGLLRRGHHVTVVPLLPRGELLHGGARELLPRTEACWPWSPRVLGAALRELARAPGACLAALGLLLTWHPRHLLANLLVYPKALWLAGRARALGIQHLHAHWATTPAALAMAAAAVAGIPWSFTGHRYDLERDDLLARKARCAAFARVISRHGARRVRARAPGARIECIHMGVDVAPPRAACEPARTVPILLCPARFVRMKNHAGLLRAFARLAVPAELWLAGAGPLRSAIARQARALGLARVRLLGALPNEDLRELYRSRRVDAVILASTAEGIPVALMEAMAAGLPVIATAVGGVAELVGNGAGLLVPPGDEARLAGAMAALVESPTLRARLGQAGRARVLHRFKLERTVARLEAGFAAHAHGAAGSRSAAGMANRTSAAYPPRYAAASASVATASRAPSDHHSSAGTTAPSSSGAA